MAKREEHPVQVTTLAQLMRLQEERRSIVVPHHAGYQAPKPAAWMVNLSGHELSHLMNMGMYVYEKKSTKRYGKRQSED